MRARLVELAHRKRLPVVGHVVRMAEAGTLFSYGISPANGLRRSAHWVDKILEGVKPADLTVKPPTRFELVINPKAAEAPGIMVPQSLLLLADEVIQ